MRTIVMVIVTLALATQTLKGQEPSKMGAEKKETTKALINDALKVIERNLDINENLTIRSTGNEGEIMQAYSKLKQASDIEPKNLELQYQRFAPCD
jgi:hypothetical protein